MDTNSSDGQTNNPSNPNLPMTWREMLEQTRHNPERERMIEGRWEPTGSLPVEEADLREQRTPASTLRHYLKVLLYEERRLPGGRGPSCAMCSKELHAPDMHEVLVPRRYIQKMPEEQQLLVYTRYNCVLVCQGGCHIDAETSEGITRCIRHLLAFEGYQAIYKWLETLLPVFCGDGIYLAQNRLEAEMRAVLEQPMKPERSWVFEK